MRAAGYGRCVGASLPTPRATRETRALRPCGRGDYEGRRERDWFFGSCRLRRPPALPASRWAHPGHSNGLKRSRGWPLLHGSAQRGAAGVASQPPEPAGIVKRVVGQGITCCQARRACSGEHRRPCSPTSAVGIGERGPAQKARPVGKRPAATGQTPILRWQCNAPYRGRHWARAATRQPHFLATESCPVLADVAAVMWHAPPTTRSVERRRVNAMRGSASTYMQRNCCRGLDLVDRHACIRVRPKSAAQNPAARSQAITDSTGSSADA